MQTAIKRTSRCEGITKRNGMNTRCKHTTTRGIYCHQHEKVLRHFRIKEDNLPKRPGYGGKWGLFTTVEIPKGKIICAYSGEKIVTDHPQIGNPYIVKIKKNTYIDGSKTDERYDGRWVKEKRVNNAELVLVEGVLFVVSTKDIKAGSEITASHELAKAPRKLRSSEDKEATRLLKLANKRKAQAKELRELKAELPVEKHPGEHGSVRETIKAFKNVLIGFREDRAREEKERLRREADLAESKRLEAARALRGPLVGPRNDPQGGLRRHIPKKVVPAQPRMIARK